MMFPDAARNNVISGDSSEKWRSPGIIDQQTMGVQARFDDIAYHGAYQWLYLKTPGNEFFVCHYLF